MAFGLKQDKERTTHMQVHHTTRLASVAVVVASVLAVRPALSSPAACTCKDIVSLTQDLTNAQTLSARFLAEEQALNKQYPPPLNDGDRLASMTAEKQFVQDVAPNGIKAPEGYHGPDSVDYTPKDIGLDNISKYSHAQQCEPSQGSQKALKQAEDGSVCRGMADAVKAHEQYHRDQCSAVGSVAYFHKSGAEKAQEEAVAYKAQADVLQAEITKLTGGGKGLPSYFAPLAGRSNGCLVIGSDKGVVPPR
jgi:hypothetical protein